MLTSPQSSLAKQLRKLHQAKGRREQACFLLEGTHLLHEALGVQWPLAVVCYTAAWQQKEAVLCSQLQQSSPRCELVSEAVLAAIATTVSPDGVVAAARSRTQGVFSPRSLGLVLETIQDPGNVGALLRTAAAAGVEGVLLDVGSADLESPKVLRSSAGAWFRVAAHRCEDVLTQVRDYRNQGFQVVATTPKADLDYWDLDYTRPTLVAVGNEGAGLSDDLMQLATVQVRIPLSAEVESLNAAIATAVVLYEAKRQRTFKGDRYNSGTGKTVNCPLP
ncbi:MAG: RNA methyltransferase [Thermosynechococcaceae cyanobacterium]